MALFSRMVRRMEDALRYAFEEALRILSTPESGATPYQWAVIALSHAMLGFSLCLWLNHLAPWPLLASQWLVVSGYVLKEIMDLQRGGSVWDGLFDALAVLAGVWMVSNPVGASLAVWGVVTFGFFERILRAR